VAASAVADGEARRLFANLLRMRMPIMNNRKSKHRESSVCGGWKYIKMLNK